MVDILHHFHFSCRPQGCRVFLSTKQCRKQIRAPLRLPVHRPHILKTAGQNQHVCKSARLGMGERMTSTSAKMQAYILSPLNVTRQLDNIYLKVRAVPPLTMTINSQCWLSLDLPCIEPPSKLVLSKTNNSPFAAQKKLSTRCNWSSSAWILDNGETQLFQSLADCKQLFLLCLILALTSDESQTKTLKFLFITEKNYKSVLKSFFQRYFEISYQ